MATRVTLPEQEIEKETMLNCMIERQHSAPSEKNLESMFSALKDGFVYIPCRLLISDEERMKINQAILAGKPVPPNPNMRISPQLLCNPEGKKIMPWFSRDAEIKSEKTEGLTFMRIPAVKAASIADNMPDAFDIILDIYTHPVQVTLDEMLEGLGMAE